MDVLLHFGATRLDLRMRRLVSGKDELGIKYASEVLTGQKGVREAIQLEGLRAGGVAQEITARHSRNQTGGVAAPSRRPTPRWARHRPGGRCAGGGARPTESSQAAKKLTDSGTGRVSKGGSTEAPHPGEDRDVCHRGTPGEVAEGVLRRVRGTTGKGRRGTLSAGDTGP